METSLPVNATPRRKTKVKSRTIARPALSGKKRGSKKHLALKLTFASGYAIALLILFQFLSLQLSFVYFENLVPPTFAKTTSTAAALKTPAAEGLPVRLKIPSIRVNAVIGSVGITANGAMGVPRRPSETSWYMFGPKPGETGSAVIAGHVNWLYGAIGVFENLHKLKPGDKITVQNDRGEITDFVVSSTRAMGQKEDASSVFLSYDGKSHLNLVTCSGVWDKVARVYSKRLVVFADKATE